MKTPGTISLSRVAHNGLYSQTFDTLYARVGRKVSNLCASFGQFEFGSRKNCVSRCVGSDYILVDTAVVDAFVEKIVEIFKRMVGNETQQKDYDGNINVSQQYCNHITKKPNKQRLMSYLEEDHGGEVLLGGLDLKSG